MLVPKPRPSEVLCAKETAALSVKYSPSLTAAEHASVSASPEGVAVTDADDLGLGVRERLGEEEAVAEGVDEETSKMDIDGLADFVPDTDDEDEGDGDKLAVAV